MVSKMQMITPCLLIALVMNASLSMAAECVGKPDPNAKPNLNPVNTAAPTFVKQVKNGKLFTVGSGDDEIAVVHLWGSAYDKGCAHATLMQHQAQAMISQTYAYFENQVISAINGTAHSLHIPQWVIDLAAELGLDGVLDLTYDITRPFTGTYFYDEMRGMADCGGLDYDTIRRVHMIGELTKGSCSMYGAWGAATASLGGRLMQLRALDWAVDGPFKNFPQLTVYHSDGSAEQGISFTNVGWTGWIGSITGLSAAEVGICEIGVSYPDATFGKESRFGVPFTFLLRDILQFDKTREDAQQHITNANRTCDLILGVGDGKTNSFRGVEYSHSVANFYSDTNMKPEATWHPRINNTVYYGMDWLCPNYNKVLARQLQKYHGNITAENTIRDITAIVQTGDLHVAIYDLHELQLYTANARGDGETGPAMAYDRAFVKVDMKAAFSEAKPTL